MILSIMCMKWSEVKWSGSCSVMSDCLQPHGLHSPWNSPGQNTGVGILQGIFPTQGLNLGLLHCRQILYQLSHKGNPRIVEWVAYPFSRGSSRPRNWTGVSCIAGGFFTNWAIWDVQSISNRIIIKQDYMLIYAFWLRVFRFERGNILHVAFFSPKWKTFFKGTS